LCWLYVFGGICSCPIYGEKPRRNRRDEVGAGSAFGRLGGGWVANLAVDRFSRSEAEPSQGGGVRGPVVNSLLSEAEFSI
jgi:hypothetical protein